MHVHGWWFKSERPVSRARPKREQLIVMCGGRRGILIFPLNATPRERECIPATRGKRATKKKRRGVVTRPPPVLHAALRPFFTSFLLPRRRRRSVRNYRREEHKRETVYLNMPYTFDRSSSSGFYAASIILRRSLRGFKPQCGKLRRTRLRNCNL